MPHSQRGVFASSGFASYWRRVQKSFTDYVGSSTMGRIPNPTILSAPTSNKHLSLPTAGIIFAAMSSKTGFAEWHASKGGWVTYTLAFPESWSRCDLIIGTSSRVPIKRGEVEAIGATTPVSKGEEKRIKQEKLKEANLEESTKGVEASPETKRRKTRKSQKQLVILKETKRIGSPIMGKKVGQSLATRTRVKTKVESSLSQVPVSSSVHGSLGSPDYVPQSPLGPFGRTRSKQKTIRDPVEREKYKASFLLLSFMLQ